MYSTLLYQKISNLARFRKVIIENQPKHKKKLDCATNKLKKLSVELSQPLLLLINAYADYYVGLFKQNTLHSVYAKIDEFILLSNFETLVKFTNQDVELAEEVDKCWNTMNGVLSKDLPFTLHNQITASGIQLMKNTFFRHTTNFIHFCFVAKFVEANRLSYPRISGLQEFFIHLPIVTKFSRDYSITEYIAPDASLDKYYRAIYDDINKEARLPKFLSLMHPGMLNVVQKSTMWGAQAAVEYLKNYDQAH